MSPAKEARPRVLCVDDDEFLLNLLTRTIGPDYELLTSKSGDDALKLLESEEPVQVIVSDHRMPGMSGAQFLQTVKDAYPSTVRVLLTGETDLAEAVAAMNQAALFRFLLKPSTRPVLLETLRAAVAQYRLQVAERELLQKTLMGSMRALSDVLALANPLAFGQVNRIQELCLSLASRLKISEQWPLEFAVLASQLGHIALPERTLRRLYAGEVLSTQETSQVAQSAHVAERILARIPRLGPVVDILTELAGSPATGVSANAPRAAEILRVAAAFAVIERATASRETAIQRLRSSTQRFDPQVIGSLTELLGLELSDEESIEVPIARISVNMIVAEDVSTRSGALLVPKGYRVSESFLARLGNFNAELLPSVIRVRGEYKPAAISGSDVLAAS